MKKMSFLIFFFLSAVTYAREFQVIQPALDQDFLNQLGMYQLGTPLPQRFNLLIVGQDNSTNRRKRDDRYLLGSRADVIMVLSINTADGSSTILSIYRGNSPGSRCQNKIGHTPSDALINGVYAIGGREEFIPCLEGMIEQRLEQNESFAALLDENGEFKIHAFFEGTRTHTIRPVARASFDVVMDNKWAFTSVYGLSAMGAAMDVLMNDSDLQSALDDEMSAEQEQAIEEASDYLLIELKERDIYKAGGYQRSFNFATVIATVLGWAAYGINQYKDDDYDFLGRYFGDIITNNFSASHTFQDLEDSVFMNNGQHLLVSTCYTQGVSPVRVIQWGESSSSYVVYENGKLDLSRAQGILRTLKLVPIVPEPPSCN